MFLFVSNLSNVPEHATKEKNRKQEIHISVRGSYPGTIPVFSVLIFCYSLDIIFICSTTLSILVCQSKSGSWTCDFHTDKLPGLLGNLNCASVNGNQMRSPENTLMALITTQSSTTCQKGSPWSVPRELSWQ